MTTLLSSLKTYILWQWWKTDHQVCLGSSCRLSLDHLLLGTSVLSVEATDADLGENAAISFSIVGGDVNLFSLNCESILVL